MEIPLSHNNWLVQGSFVYSYISSTLNQLFTTPMHVFKCFAEFRTCILTSTNYKTQHRCQYIELDMMLPRLASFLENEKIVTKKWVHKFIGTT